MKFILVLYIGSTFGNLSYAESLYHQATAELDNGNYLNAYNLLETIPATDSNFEKAVAILQRHFYRSEQWQKFFAYAKFYRQRLLSHTQNIHFDANLISLESIALAKHCYWQEASSIINWSLEHAKIEPRAVKLLNEAKAIIDLQKDFSLKELEAKEDQKTISPVFTETQTWKLESAQLANISHPRLLRVKLRSRCAL